MHGSTRSQVQTKRRARTHARVLAVVALWLAPLGVAATWAGSAGAATPPAHPAALVRAAPATLPAAAQAGAHHTTLALPAATVTAAASTARSPAPGIEASRPDATIGKWVVVALLALLAALWVTLVAVVVRIHTAIASDRE